MDALILAAGRGERMRPLTDRTPKPLLAAGGQSLIERHVQALTRAGIKRLVVNHAHLGEQIIAHLGTGRRFGTSIRYSPEPPGALDTGGGIVNALRLLGSDPFLVVNGDIWTDFDFRTLPGEFAGQAWLVLVSNPPHHPGGDFRLHHGLVLDLAADQGTPLTFSGVGLYRRALFADLAPGRFPLAPILRRAIANREVHGLHFTGAWYDVGTPARLETLQRRLATAT
jgi:MurNAc alpha-1-phosphate uridylyltransferase